jgi:RNA-directed DNA polymerase
MGQPVELASRRASEWDAIEWAVHERHVRRMQEQIFRATRSGAWKAVKNLQKLLARSRSARLVAVKRVTQENKGRHTAGIDGKTYLSSRARLALVGEIGQIDASNYWCSPVLRKYIPKARGGKRPLGIPTVKDRVVQMIVKAALEPEWEAKFEPNSFGFRPGRCCQDAVKQIWLTIKAVQGRTTSAWILDADISKCFDNIDHEALLRRVPVFARTIRRWLKAGVVEFGKYYKTKAGTPQGGVISPLLANVALDGMERLFGIESRTGRYIPPAHRRGRNAGISVIRYADDFVVSAPSREIIVEYVVPVLQEFFASRGLELSETKTRIVHRDEGFDFLGFAIREFHNSQGAICLVQPSKEAVRRHLAQVKDYLSRNKQAKVEDVIAKLNPILRGWAYYYRHCNAKKTFSWVDHRVWEILWRWCVRRHPGKGKNWVKQRYFRRINGRDWTFSNGTGFALFWSSRVRVSSKEYAKVRGDSSPFDPALRAYWKRRNGKRGIGAIT